jgi:hypothetical protein
MVIGRCTAYIDEVARFWAISQAGTVVGIHVDPLPILARHEVSHSSCLPSSAPDIGLPAQRVIGERHQRPDSGRVAKLGMGQDPQVHIEILDGIGHPDQPGVRVSNVAGQKADPPGPAAQAFWTARDARH